jgi:hypothetical protein
MNVPDITPTKPTEIRARNIGANLRRRQNTQKFSFGLLWLASLVVLLILVGVGGYVFITGFKSLSWEFLTTAPQRGAFRRGRHFHHNPDHDLPGRSNFGDCCAAWDWRGI